ncbi:MAG: UDP-N-acetylmuramate dehydrogenase [Lysobacterales bacterium]
MHSAAELTAQADLSSLNSFGVRASAAWLARAETEAQLLGALDRAAQWQLPVQVLGGGSNVLIVDDLDAMVLLPRLRGIEWLGAAGNRIHVRAAAGENWHAFVAATLAAGAFGLENLALIPGHVGAAPIQNIGAYGVELAQFVVAVEAIDQRGGRSCRIEAGDCGFAYRDSLFKRPEGAHLLITAVEFALHSTPELVLGYAGVTEELGARGVDPPTPQAVFDAVVAIRRRKLPDPAVLGNAGSFFKNPWVSRQAADELKQRHPALPVYPVDEGTSKLAAGWLIDACGWRGYRDGDAGVHQQHALVLVNYGRARGADILQLARRIQADVQSRFGVELEIEPRLLGMR